MATYSRITQSGELSNFDQTLVSARVQLAAQQMFPVERVVAWESKTPNTGRVSQLTQFGASSLATLTESSTLGMTDATAAIATTNRTITQAVKGRDFGWSLLAEHTGTSNFDAAAIDTLTKATVKDKISALMALYTEAGSGANLIGDGASAFSFKNHFLPGFAQIAAGQIGGSVNLILSRPALIQAGGDDYFSKWQNTGRAMLDSNVSMPTGWIDFVMWNVGAWFVNDYSTDGANGNYSIMLAQEAIKVEEILPPLVTRYTAQQHVGSSAVLIGLRTIYGIGGTRDTSTTNAGVVAFYCSN